MRYVKSTLALMLLTVTLVSCKKESSNVVKLTAADSAKITIVPLSKVIIITLSNPADGGYKFNNWEYDTTILRLGDHLYVPPADIKKYGDAGKDTWSFTPLTTGSTNIRMTVSRGNAGAKHVPSFRATIKVE
jgi:predicted secreted protein